MGRWLAALVVGGLIGCASVARAQSFALEWSAPDGCPSGAEMNASIERLLAQSQASGAQAGAVGKVARKGARWTLRLTLDVQGRRATRTLSAADCASLSDTAAWLVAVSIDPQLSPPTADPDSPAAPSDPAVAATAPAPSTTPAQVKAAEEERPQSEEGEESGGSAPDIGCWLGIYSGAFAGGLAGPNPSLGARFGVEIGGFSLDLAFAHHFATGRELDEPPEGESVFSAQELALSGCYGWGSELRIGPCAVVSGLRVQGKVEHIAQPAPESVLWSTLGASLAIAYRGYAPWLVFADGGLWLPLSKRPHFEVAELGSVGDGAGLGGRVRLGVGLSLR